MWFKIFNDLKTNTMESMPPSHSTAILPPGGKH